MWGDYFFNILDSGVNLSVLIIAILTSILFFYLFKKSEKINKKIVFLYSGIAFLIMPFIFSAFNWDWHSISSVFNCNPKYVMILIPSSLIGSFSFGFFVMPYLYKKFNSSKVNSSWISDFVDTESKRLGIKPPKVYVIRKAKPAAHSFTNIKPAIFISVGMFELLSKKEIEAVLLHELYHIKQRFSFSKFSTFFLKIFIPVPSFNSLLNHLGKEEENADEYACNMQKTNRNILSAKRKVNYFIRIY